MTEPVIKVNNITKSFKIYYDKSTNLKEKALFAKRNRFEEHEVLKGISFEVMPGEAIGIIGANGCGKSTILKLLSRIMYPDSGTIEMKGRVSALIELGAGFHPDMSGRENIYTNAAIFGLSRKEIDERLQRIIDFSELGEYIDNPVRTYSSGMYMRLAFSVAINVDADILLVDEILAVGDAAFQAKCFNRMREIKASGTTIVIVSHALGQIEQICDRTYWIRDGHIEMAGKPGFVHPSYLAYMGGIGGSRPEFAASPEHEQPAGEPQPAAEEQQDSRSSNRWGNGMVHIEDVVLVDGRGEEKNIFHTGEQIRICVSYTAAENTVAVFGIGISDLSDIIVYGTNTLVDHIGEIPLQKQGKVFCDIPQLSLVAGEYILAVAFHKPDGFPFDYWKDAKRIIVYSEYEEVGIAHLNHKWSY